MYCALGTGHGALCTVYCVLLCTVLCTVYCVLCTVCCVLWTTALGRDEKGGESELHIFRPHPELPACAHCLRENSEAVVVEDEDLFVRSLTG